MKDFLGIGRLFSKIKQKSISFVGNLAPSFSGFENIFDSLNIQAFKRSLYLFIGVSMIRDTVSSIPIDLYRIKGTDGDTEEVHDDPSLTLMERPNILQTKMEFWKLGLSYYLLAGETFIFLERPTPGAFPSAWINLRPDRVQIVLSQGKNEVVGYEYQSANGDMIKIRPEDMLHVKNIDPTNPIRGIGVVRPATQRIITEEEASKFQAQSFRNQGMPQLAILTERDSLTTEDAADARESFKKVYGTGEYAAGFFGKDIRDIKELSKTPKEMDFMATQNFLRDDILAALRIPKAMITSDDVNLANSKTARINYLKEACLPVLDTFLDILNNKFLTGEDEDKFFSYESPVQEDRELLLKEAVELKKAGIVSVNEARAILSYEEIEGGDAVAESTGVSLQLAMKSARLKREAKRHLKHRRTLLRKFKAVDALTELLLNTKVGGVKRERNSVFATREAKEAYIKAFDNIIDTRSDGFHAAVNVYNEGLYARIIENIEKLGLSPDNIFDASFEIGTAEKIFVPLMKEMYQRTGEDTMDFISNGFSQKASEGFFTLPAVLQALELRAEFFITSMLNTDYKQLKKIIADGMAEGSGVLEIGRSIREYFDDMSVARARTIARTETGRLMSEATQDAYSQSEFVTGKEWLTAGDEKVRPEHRMNDGVIVAVNEAFPNGERFPGESTINCRCAIAPAV